MAFSQALQDMIAQAAGANNIPLPIANRLVQVESGGNASVSSNKGAVGLTQLMPGTATEMGVTDRTDPQQNLNGGFAYLGKMYSKFGNWSDALAAYNAGPNAGPKAWAQGQAYADKFSNAIDKASNMDSLTTGVVDSSWGQNTTSDPLAGAADPYQASSTGNIGQDTQPQPSGTNLYGQPSKSTLDKLYNSNIPDPGQNVPGQKTAADFTPITPGSKYDKPASSDWTIRGLLTDKLPSVSTLIWWIVAVLLLVFGLWATLNEESLPPSKGALA